METFCARAASRNQDALDRDSRRRLRQRTICRSFVALRNPHANEWVTSRRRFAGPPIVAVKGGRICSPTFLSVRAQVDDIGWDVSHVLGLT